MGGGGVQRISKFLKYWDYTKYQVSLLTVKSSHFYAEDKSLIKDIPETVDIYRTGTFDPFRLIYLLKKVLQFPEKKEKKLQKESGGFLRRLSNLLFIPDSRILWFPFALSQACKINKNNKIDLIVATMPPFTTGIVALMINKILKIPYILDFRDSWTQNPYMPKITPFHNFIHSWLESITTRNALAVTCVNPNLKKYYLNRFPFLLARPVTVIRNGFDPDDFSDLPKSPKLIDKKKFNIGIMGTVYSQGNSPKPLLDALYDLRKDDPQMTQKVKVVFIGKWTSNFLESTKSYSLNNTIDWIQYLPHHEALSIANNMTALAIFIDSNLTGSENLTPGRIYEYLYFKKPILALCPKHSDLAFLVKHFEAGITIDYDDLDSLKMVLSQWISTAADFQREFKFKNPEEFHRKYLTEKMMKFIEVGLG
jgi:glycosyltransferase involved in cell wall biosynthesis